MMYLDFLKSIQRRLQRSNSVDRTYLCALAAQVVDNAQVLERFRNRVSVAIEGHFTVGSYLRTKEGSNTDLTFREFEFRNELINQLIQEEEELHKSGTKLKEIRHEHA